ncbi:MAG: PfkB family carbohydrate kinase [Corynebacterium sp.]|uniref:PfkB family carbohydrate kinase n=1 Tax=Corynebacterium sp. TaxID=1720 RepID=UPI0026DB10AE|nr:PfkB family carbohydrate kinase [Corynebacterium sp.]MDO5029737.1 PfkB family carbohydrate kinase [Corynebacterium sp.]
MQARTSLNETPTVVVCGSIHLDTLVKVDSVPADGGTLIVDDGTDSLGGKGANQAVAIAYDGVRAVMAGTVGEDRAADVVIEELTAHGVDVHSIRTSWDMPTGSAFVATNKKGRPVIFVQRGADKLTDPTDFVDEFATADIVLAQGELLPQATEAIAAVASMHNARLVLNLSPVTVATPALIDHADPLIVNMKGAWETLRRLDIAEGILATDYRAQIEALLQYCPSVIMLRGDHGCLYAEHATGLEDQPTIYEQPALTLPEEKVVDGTGSGDAFVGTLTAELAKGSSLADAVTLATAAGAAAVQAMGACAAFAPRAQLLEMIEDPDFPAAREFKG